MEKERSPAAAAWDPRGLCGLGARRQAEEKAVLLPPSLPVVSQEPVSPPAAPQPGGAEDSVMGSDKGEDMHKSDFLWY